MAALAAQQYYVEMGADLVPERLNRMIPSVIPDSFLAGHGMSEKWMEMIIDSFRKVLVIYLMCDVKLAAVLIELLLLKLF